VSGCLVAFEALLLDVKCTNKSQHQMSCSFFGHPSITTSNTVTLQKSCQKCGVIMP